MTRERWFGASGRLVPEIAVEGELDLDDALVLEGVSDEAALARPEVACVLVPPDKRELVELDLTELTYG